MHKQLIIINLPLEAFAVNTIIPISSRWLLSSMILNSILRTKVEKSYEITKQKPEGDFKAPTRFLIIWTLSCLSITYFDNGNKKKRLD